MAKLRVLDVDIHCVSFNGGHYPGYDATVFIVPAQPLVRVTLKMCDDAAYMPNKKNRIVTVYRSEPVPLYMLFGEEVIVKIGIKEETAVKLHSFGPRVMEFIQRRADLMFSREPIHQLSYASCPSCGTVIHANNPVDFARHAVVNGSCTCNKLWFAAVENEQLRTINMRIQQRCDYMVDFIQKSYINMCSMIQYITQV